MHISPAKSWHVMPGPAAGNVRFGLGRLDEHGRFKSVNPSLSELLGFSADEFVHMTLTDIVHPDDLEELKPLLEQVLTRQARGLSLELQVLPKGGAAIWAMCQLLAIYDENDAFLHGSLIISELPSYSQPLSALRANERHHQTLLSNLAGVAYRSRVEKNAELTLEYVSEGTRDLFGVEPGQLMSGAITPADLVHPDDFKLMRETVLQALKDHTMARVVLRVLQPDGSYRWALETCRGVYDENGKVEAVEGFINDIHEQKLIEERLSESEKALRERERQHKTLLSNLMGVAFRLRLTKGGFHITYISDGLRDLFGVEPDDMLSEKVKPTDLIEKSEFEAMWLSIRKAAASRTSSRNVIRGRQPDGSFRWMVVTCRGLCDENGRIVDIEGLITDIHEQKLTEERLYRSELELREAHELVGLGRWELDHKTGNVTWSDETYRIFGQDPETYSPTIRDFQETILHPDDRDSEAELMKAALEGKAPYHSVHRIIRPDGDVRFIAERGETSFDAGGNPLRTVGTTLDVTDLKRAEMALVEEQAFKHALLETSDFAVIACDANGKLKMFNRTAREWHGLDAMAVPPEEWGKHYDLYGPDGTRPIRTNAIPLMRAFNGETVREAEMSIVRPGLPPRLIICNGAPLHDASGRKLGAMVIMRDITRQRMIEANLRQRDAILSAVAFAAERLLTTWDWEQEIETILSTLGQAMHASRAYVLRTTTDQRKRTFASILYEWCGPDVPPTYIWSSPKGIDIAAAGLGHWAERMQLGGVMQTRSRDFLPAEQAVMEPDGIKAIIAIPVFVHGELFGMLGFDDCTSDRHWSLAEQEALRAAANTIASAIERRRQQEDRLARVVAEEANHAKSSFLATMSHEIRTPMNAILGLSEILAQSNLTEEQADQLTAMHDAGRHLLNLIDDILDISKIEAGQLKMRPVEISICETVEAVVSSLTSTANEKGVVLHVFVEPDLPDRILSDGLRLRQVIYNLLGNAIKFSAELPDRTGRVELRVDAEEGDPFELRITVRDNGIGMAEELLERVFEPFAQGDSQVTRRYGGTGLGLAITRRIVAMMGGRVSVFSVLDEGSTFTLNIPVDIVEQDETAGRTYPLKGRRCIVADSSSYIANDIAAYLRHAGADAVELAAQPSGLDGASLVVCGAEYIESEWSLPEVPHLLIEHGRGRRPQALSPLITAIDGTGLSYPRLVEGASQALGLAAKVARTRPAETGRQHDDYSGLNPILVAEDDPLNQKVILQQLKLLNLKAELADNGEEAIAMAQEGRYSLLLTDLHMPDLDGYQLARTIRTRQAQAAKRGETVTRLPILALTADARQQVFDAITEAGIDGLLIKPITLKGLDEALRPWLVGAQAELTGDAPDTDSTPAPATDPSATRDLPASPPPAGPGATNPGATDPVEAAPGPVEAVLDLSELAARIGDDIAMQREFLEAFHEQMIPLAGQLCSAAESADLSTAGAIAHRLKSTSRAVGAMELGAICASIEDVCQKDDPNELSPLLARFRHAADAVGIAIGNAVATDRHVGH